MIAAEQALDGLYVVRSNVDPEVFDADQTVRAYKRLLKVERAFRSMDLKVRPFSPPAGGSSAGARAAVHAAYYVEWHMRRPLAPLLFDDHDREGAERKRVSEVASAQRSSAAAAKASSKRTEDGLSVHSIRTLINDLGTLTAHTMRVAEGDSTSRCHAADAGSAPLLRAAWPPTSHVATHATPKNPGNYRDHHDSEHCSWKFGLRARTASIALGRSYVPYNGMLPFY